MKLSTAAVAMLSIGLLTPGVDRAESLREMVNAERAFAAAARVKGVRDAFVEFFEDGAVALVPQPEPAKARLRSRRSRPFSAFELTWEPRAGDVASSGDFGWLTGPSRSIDHQAATPEPRYGAYLSIWRRQDRGPWRVHLDIGIATPEPVSFAGAFTHLQRVNRYAGPPEERAGLDPLLEADRRLNAAIAASGLTQAFAAAMDPDARLHWGGQQPIAGRAAILAALQGRAAPLPMTAGSGAVATSADLGYTYGTCQAPGGDTLTPYVRIWARDASGRWWLMLDLVERST